MDEESKDVSASTDVVADTATDVSSATEEVSTNEAQADVSTDAANETDQSDSEAAGESEETEAGDGEELKPKSQNRFQKLANENRDLKERIAQLEQLAVPTEQDYLEGGYEPTEAKLNALEAKIAQRDQIEKVTSLNHAIDNDMARIIHDFPQLDPKNEQFNKELAIDLFTQYDRDSGAQYTDDGITLNTNQLPYQYIRDKMRLIEKARAEARVKAQKNVESMVSAAETTSSKAPVITKEAKDMSTKELEANLGIVYQ